MTCTIRSAAEPTPRRAMLDAPRTGRARTVARTVLGLVALAGLACSSAPPTTDQWTETFVEPPERVWVAINQTLEALGYEIEEADRHNSIIVATSGSDDTDPPVVLRVAQVARTEVVRVHVTPHDGGAESDRFDTAAREFLAALDSTVQLGVPPSTTDGP